MPPTPPQDVKDLLEQLKASVEKTLQDVCKIKDDFCEGKKKSEVEAESYSYTATMCLMSTNRELLNYICIRHQQWNP